MLAVLTGPVRSGKSSAGLRLALASGVDVVVAVGGSEDDDEMRRRISRHRMDRPSDVRVLETTTSGWREQVADDACLLLDCLGTVLGASMWPLVPADAELASMDAEEAAHRMGDELVEWLLARNGPTVVVTNEVGWGVVPPTPLGRLFRDVLGRANRQLVDAADIAWLVVSGRCIQLTGHTQEASWPST